MSEYRNPNCGQPEGYTDTDICACGCSAYYDYCGDKRCLTWHHGITKDIDYYHERWMRNYE